jgi:hypothetical protein
MCVLTTVRRAPTAGALAAAGACAAAAAGMKAMRLGCEPSGPRANPLQKSSGVCVCSDRCTRNTATSGLALPEYLPSAGRGE